MARITQTIRKISSTKAVTNIIRIFTTRVLISKIIIIKTILVDIRRALSQKERRNVALGLLEMMAAACRALRAQEAARIQWEMQLLRALLPSTWWSQHIAGKARELWRTLER